MILRKAPPIVTGTGLYGTVLRSEFRTAHSAPRPRARPNHKQFNTGHQALVIKQATSTRARHNPLRPQNPAPNYKTWCALECLQKPSHTHSTDQLHSQAKPNNTQCQEIHTVIQICWDPCRPFGTNPQATQDQEPNTDAGCASVVPSLGADS